MAAVTTMRKVVATADADVRADALPAARMRLKTLDVVIAVAAAAFVAITAVSAYEPGGGQAGAVIKGRDGEWVYPLTTDRELRVAGPLGDTVIEIRGKSLRVEDSPCPNTTCVATGSIDRPGQWLACLPNQVIVRIEGRRQDGGVDASVY